MFDLCVTTLAEQGPVYNLLRNALYEERVFAGPVRTSAKHHWTDWLLNSENSYLTTVFQLDTLILL